MTRALTAAVLSQLTTKEVQVGILVELNTDAGPVRAWSGIGDLISGGNTFQGVGHLGGISPVQESGAEIRANALSLQLSGIPSSLISTALTTQYQGRPAKVWLAFFEPKVNPYALSFDGVDDQVSLGDVHDFAGIAPFTVECWARIAVGAAATELRIVCKEDIDGNGRQGWFISKTAGTSFYAGRILNNVEFTRNTGTLQTEVWYHLRLVYTGSVTRLFLDGVQQGSDISDTQSIVNTPVAAFFGRNAPEGRFFKGNIDDVRIWNVAHTDPDWLRRLAGNESGLVGYWRIDEGSGTQAKDATANANHGTITGAAWTQDTGPLVGDLAFSTPGLIADPILVFSGRADVMMIDEGPETATITITVESRLADLLRPRVRRYTDQEQKAMFPGDRGLEFVASLQDRELQWGGGAASGTSLPPVIIDEGGAGGWRA